MEDSEPESQVDKPDLSDAEAINRPKDIRQSADLAVQHAPLFDISFDGRLGESVGGLTPNPIQTEKKVTIGSTTRKAVPISHVLPFELSNDAHSMAGAATASSHSRNPSSPILISPCTSLHPASLCPSEV